MPCGSQRNYEQDMRDAMALSRRFSIDTVVVDLTAVRNSLVALLETSCP
jgi:hypothetical protein